MVLLDAGTPGTRREIFSEDADDGTRTGKNISHAYVLLSVVRPCLHGAVCHCQTKQLRDLKQKWRGSLSMWLT